MPATRCQSAILLAAGLGTRLRPLTAQIPKPLLPIGQKCLIDFPLAQLAQAGVTHVVINLHYRGDQIRDYVGNGARYGLTVTYSEEVAILGTGGGIRQAASSLPDQSAFFVMNGDVWCDLDLRRLWRAHAHAPDGTAATLAVRRLSPGEAYTPLRIDAHDRLIAIGEGAHHYIGMLIGTQELLDILPKLGTPSCLVQDGLRPLLIKQIPLLTYLHDGPWSDVGTPDDLAAVRAGR